MRISPGGKPDRPNSHNRNREVPNGTDEVCGSKKKSREKKILLGGQANLGKKKTRDPTRIRKSCVFGGENSNVGTKSQNIPGGENTGRERGSPITQKSGL